MAFRSVSFAHLSRFNSANSSDFLDFYDNHVETKIKERNAQPSSKTFAPSSIRCLRKSWFRLRGTQPDTVKSVDKTLNFVAEIGTACHRTIQSNLKEALGSNWIAVKDYLAANPIPYEYEIVEDEFETKVSIKSPPIHFACDGIILWKGKIYLLEIKTSEYASFNDLTNPKSEHIAQIKCYASLLNIDHILVLYQDRLYGGLKCYELDISSVEKSNTLQTFDYVQSMVESNIAPEPLPINDSWCTPSMCEYYKTCSKWGR